MTLQRIIEGSHHNGRAVIEDDSTKRILTVATHDEFDEHARRGCRYAVYSAEVNVNIGCHISQRVRDDFSECHPFALADYFRLSNPVMNWNRAFQT